MVGLNTINILELLTSKVNGQFFSGGGGGLTNCLKIIFRPNRLHYEFKESETSRRAGLI